MSTADLRPTRNFSAPSRSSSDVAAHRMTFSNCDNGDRLTRTSGLMPVFCCQAMRNSVLGSNGIAFSMLMTNSINWPG